MTYGWSRFVGLVFVLIGCGGTEIRSTRSDGAGGSGGSGMDAGGSGSNVLIDTLVNKTVDKVDLLFMIDNSPSMADKQGVLADAIPDLVNRLLSPACVDETGGTMPTPPDPTAPCPAGATRAFKPITNIHIAVITSSLGGHGATICEGTEAENDHAELLGSRPRGMSSVYPAGGSGFLDWNPGTNAGEDMNQFAASVQNMVRAAGADGCALPAQLEAVYRFLSDPFPPQSILLQQCHGSSAQCATPAGVDSTIVAQRKAFLRPDSLVAVIMLTDQNDCSIRDSDQYFYAAMVQDLLPRASTACGANPNDPCCYSCGLAKPPDCPLPDPACGPPPPSLTPLEDAPRLRCFEQKRRFGIDFLYPIKRYVNALTSTTLCTTNVDLSTDGNCPERPDKSPGLVANPLFQDLTNSGGVPRDPSLVYVAAITGVPWQLIAVDPTDPTLRYKTSDQMTSENTWAAIVGDPSPSPSPGSPPVLPTDPHMQESIDPRPGLPGPNTPPDADPINGHEWLIPRRDDLQYACVFSKPPTSACVDSTCDCFSRQPGDNNPVCWDGTQYVTNDQFKAKAYPSLRELELLHQVGRNAIVASLCARNLADATAQDYGYRPAVAAIADRLKESLTAKCLPRKLDVAPDGTVACTVLEATTDPTGSCDPAMNRKKPDPRLIDPARKRLQADGACDTDPNTAVPDCGRFSICEIMKADDSCLTVSPNPSAIGWCYVDPSANLGDPSIVARCPSNQRQIIRFVGDNTPARGGIVLFSCGTALISGASNMGTGTVPPS